jgi:hypothetical protein
MTKLFRRLNQLCGLELTPEVMDEFTRLDFTVHSFEVVPSDIKKLAERTKHMNLVEYAEGTALVLQSKKARTASQSARLFAMGTKRYAAAVLSKPDDYLTLNAWASACWDRYHLFILSAVTSGAREISLYVTQHHGLFDAAMAKWALSQNHQKVLDCARDLAGLIPSLESVQDLTYIANTAQTAFATSVSIKDTYEALIDWASLLLSMFRKQNRRKTTLQLVGEKFALAVRNHPQHFNTELRELVTHASGAHLGEDLGTVFATLRAQTSSDCAIRELDVRKSDDTKSSESKASGNQITASCLKLIATHCTGLQNITLEHQVSVNDDLLKKLSTLSLDLKSLALQGCLLTDGALEGIEKWKNLTKLDLRGSKLGSRALARGNHTKSESLTLQHSRNSASSSGLR